MQLPLERYAGVFLTLGGFGALVIGIREALGAGWAMVVIGIAGLLMGSTLFAADATSRRSSEIPPPPKL